MTVMENRAKRGDASDGTGAGGTLGARLSRVDGIAKIRGAAPYALEHRPADLAHAVLVQSTVAAGRVRTIDAAAAEVMPGVLLVVTADNALQLKTATNWLGVKPNEGPYRPLTHEITFYGQHIAAVVAETLEQATEAAALLKITYDEAPAIASFDDPSAGEGTAVDALNVDWGDAATALATAPVKIEHEYRTPRI